MARGNVGFVNVGQVINPVDSLSRSLTGLSNMYANKSDREQARKVQDRSLLLKAKQEDRAQKTFDTKEQQRLSAIEFNKLAADYNSNTQKYSLDALDPNIAKDITRGREAIAGAQSDFTKYLSGEQSEEALKSTLDNYKKYLNVSDLTEDAKVDALNNYRQGLLATGEKLATLDGKGKKALIDDLSYKKFGHRLEAVDKDITTGRHLLRADKVKAYISQLPQSVKENVPYDVLYKTIENQTGGTTAKEMLDAEKTRVKDLNAANSLMYNRGMTAVNNSLSKSGSTSANWKSSDLKNALEGIEGIDIGIFDNVDVKEAANEMLAAGKHPMAIYSAIKQSIDTNMFGSSFFNKADDPAAYKNFTALVDTLDGNLKSGKGGGVSKNYSTKSLQLTPAVARTLSEIRRGNIKFKGDSARLIDLLNPQTKKLIADRAALNPTKAEAAAGTEVVESPAVENNTTVDSISSKVDAYNSLTGVAKARAFELLAPEVKKAVIAGNSKPFFDEKYPEEYNEYAISPLGVGGSTKSKSRSLKNYVATSKANNKKATGKYSDEYVSNLLNNLPLIPEEVVNKPYIFSKSPEKSVLAPKPQVDIEKAQALMNRNLGNSQRLRNKSRSVTSPELRIDNLDMTVSEMQKAPEKAKNKLLPEGSVKGFRDFMSDISKTSSKAERAAMLRNYVMGAYEPAKVARSGLSNRELALKSILQRNTAQ